MFGTEWRTVSLIGGGLLGLAVVLLILLRLWLRGARRRRTRRPGDLDLSEVLAEYPAPPAAMSIYRLLIDGFEARVRLIVVAPAGAERDPLAADDVPDLLDEFRHGLADLIRADKPRIRIWPPQLSSTGFAPTFFRLVESPDAPGERSHWTRIAGPIKISGKAYLLGLACLTDHAGKLGAIPVTANQWRERLAIDR